MLGLEGLWLGLTFGMAEAGCPAGYLGPGGLHRDGQFRNCSGGAAGYIDRKFFTSAHIYGDPTSHPVFWHDEYWFGEGDLQAYDPEGILGSINSILIVFLGLQAGRIFNFYETFQQRAIRLSVWGIVLTAVGGALTGLNQFQEGNNIPIAKNLWTLSFVLVMAGWGFLLLLVLYFLIDHKKVWDGAPFYFVGMNSILVYLLHEILEGQIPFCGDECGGFDSHAQKIAMQIGAVATWFIYLYWMKEKKFFLVI